MNLRSFSGGGKTLFVLILTLLLSGSLFARPSSDVWVRSPSESCRHGIHITFVDKDNDGVHDWAIVWDCDGIMTEGPSPFTGVGQPLPKDGALARELSGSLFETSYIVEIYTVDDHNVETKLGFLVKESDQQEATFYYVGYYER